MPEGDSLERLALSLQPHGYEPRIEDERMVLENCPFDKVARDHTELVCGLNLEFVDGVADGLGCADLGSAWSRLRAGAASAPVETYRVTATGRVSIETRCPPETR